MIDRSAAWSVLTEFTQTDSLRKHALAVEAVMRAYAGRYGADGDAWGIAMSPDGAHLYTANGPDGFEVFEPLAIQKEQRFATKVYLDSRLTGYGLVG